MSVEILYLARNRREFTKASLGALIRNTTWRLVDRLVMYDDNSVDGANDELHAASSVIFPRCSIEVRLTNYGSPVAVMNDYVLGSEADLFVKLDNDVMVPPGWLEALLSVMERRPDVELLGMEAGMTRVVGRHAGYGDLPWDGTFDFEPSTHIGGIGLMRRSAFTVRPLMVANEGSRNGFTEWQHTYEPVRGWITPDLPVPLLDRMPMEPWAGLSRKYVKAGWQRPWASYDERWMKWAWEWFDPTTKGGA